MRLQSIEITNFRNHTQTSVTCAERVNGVIGENGEGKTNLLEAISYLCLTKSFFGSHDVVVLQLGKQHFSVNGELVGDNGVVYRVGVTYDAQERTKQFSVNGAQVERFTDVVGRFPVVVLSPESALITAGSPADRRKFMDFSIAQSSKVYLDDLLAYRRTLRQRNKALFDARAGRQEWKSVLEPWDIELVKLGARIMVKRRGFLEELQPIVQERYAEVAGRSEEPTIRYRPSVQVHEAFDEGNAREVLEQRLARVRGEELRTAMTMVGPHRDEMELRVNGLDVRSYASQGQHKTLLISLKMAEFFYLSANRDERPLLLLDDMFGELDRRRSTQLLELTGSLGQAFVTATSETVFPVDFTWGDGNRKFVVHDGSVMYDKAAITSREEPRGIGDRAH